MEVPAIWVVVAAFLLLAVVERAFALREGIEPRWHRWGVNIGLSALTFGTAALLVQPVSGWVIAQGSALGIGLLHWVEWPAPVEWGIGFLWLDLSFYYWHRLNHEVPLLWRFHNVHHVDPALDVSTGFRFHYGEVALSALFRVAQLGIIGVPLVLLLAHEVIFQIETFFHHSNVRLPERLERFLHLVIVTPRMHGIHHSQQQRHTNSNYSVIFNVWDRVHGTLTWNVPQSTIRIGVPGYSAPADNRLTSLLVLPFKRQREYWASPRRAQGPE